MPVEECPADCRRLRVAPGRLGALPLRDRSRIFPHRRCRRPVVIASCAVDRGQCFAVTAPRREPADDAPRRVAHRVGHAHHLLPAGQHIGEQALHLGGHAGTDQPRGGALEDPEQGEPPLRRHDVLALRRHPSQVATFWSVTTSA